MADTTAGFVVGKSTIDGVRCDHLAFRGYGVDWQIWIEDGARALPRKYVISTVDVVGAPQFEVHHEELDDQSGRQSKAVPLHTAGRGDRSQVPSDWQRWSRPMTNLTKDDCGDGHGSNCLLRRSGT